MLSLQSWTHWSCRVKPNSFIKTSKNRLVNYSSVIFGNLAWRESTFEIDFERLIRPEAIQLRSNCDMARTTRMDFFRVNNSIVQLHLCGKGTFWLI